jgi:hypothetical protein
MVTNKRKLFVLEQRRPTGTKGKPEDDVDALFRLPLAEFTGARNALAAQLKKSGRGDEAAYVKALVKPSVSAWAVNQLYWNHRDEFDQLIASGERFHKAQTSRIAAKSADMRAALDARREALTQLAEFATSLLRNAGHNPALETVHRITTTLEAISAYASRSDAPRPGRLTQDVDPPGFELFGSSSSVPVMPKSKENPAALTPSQRSKSDAASKRLAADHARRAAEMRKANIADARAALQEAKRSVTEARAKIQSLESGQKKVLADAKEAEKRKREAEEHFKKATAAAEDAARRAKDVGVEAQAAAKELKDASLRVEEASRELEKLFREE